MKRGLGLSFLAGLMVFSFVHLASASITMDFESPTFAPDDGFSDVTHNLVVGPGNIDFNGNIDNTLDDGDIYPDHTTGDGYFLKNTWDDPTVTMNFDFDVAAIDFYWLGLQGISMNGEVYDFNGDFLDGGSEEGTEAWAHVFAGPYGSPIRSIAFWSDNGGDDMAIDDLTLYLPGDPLPGAEIPEPASMALLGIGLFGLAARRPRRKK